MRIQSPLGSTHSYRESEEIFDLCPRKPRQVTNLERIKRVVESVGQYVERMKKEVKEIIATPPAAELTLKVDGGHIKTTTEDDKQTMEAMIFLEGLNPLLQLRAVIQSHDWEHNWRTAILNAV